MARGTASSPPSMPLQPGQLDVDHQLCGLPADARVELTEASHGRMWDFGRILTLEIHRLEQFRCGDGCSLDSLCSSCCRPSSDPAYPLLLALLGCPCRTP